MVEKLDMPGRNPFEAPEGSRPKEPPKTPKVKSTEKPPTKSPAERVVYVGIGKSEKASVAEEQKSPQETRKPVLPAEDAQALRLENAKPEVVFEHALAHDPEFSHVLGSKPIQNEGLRTLVSESIVNGDSLKDTALKIKDARLSGKVASGEADFMLARISRIIGEPIIVEISGGSDRWEFYKKDPSLSVQTQRELQKIQDVFDKDPLLTDDTRYLDRVATRLAETKLPQKDSGAIRDSIDRLRKRQGKIEEHLDRLREEQRFSSLVLTPGERDGLRDNPEWTVEEMLRRIEEVTVLFPDERAAETAERRINLMSEYFTHQQYLTDIDSYIVSDPDKKFGGPNSPQAQQYKAERINLYRELSEKVSFRSGILRAYGSIRGVGDPETMWKSLLNLGTAGFEYLLRENGGLVDVAFNKYVEIFKHWRFAEDGSLRRLTGEELMFIREAVVQEMIRDKAIYDETYKKSGFRDEEDLSKLRNLTDKDCRSIVRMAEYAVLLSQQDLVAMLGGLGPGESDIISSFASASTAEKMLAAMDINRWFFEKWTNLQPGQLVIWQNACRLAAETTGKAEFVGQKMRGIAPGSNEYLKLVREAFGGGKDEKILEAMNKFISVSTERNPLKPLESIDQLGEDKLRDRLMIVEGEKVVGGLLEVYDHFSSTWRARIHTDQLDKTWEYGETLGLGLRLRREGYVMISAETREKQKEGRNKTRDVLRTVSKYRPNALFEFLSDGKDVATRDWFDKKQKEGLFSSAFRGQTTERADHIHKLIARRHIAINELLAEEGLPPIDYSAGPTNAQMAILNRVCREMKTNAGAYTQLMQEMSGFVKEQIQELTTEKYHRIYYRTQWIDDARLRYLEDPENAPGKRALKKNERPRQKISNVIAIEGRGDAEALVRTWRDGGLAMKTVQEVLNTLTPDEKTYMKSITIMHQNIRVYSGDTYATRAALFLLGGWGKTAKTDKLYDWLYLGGLQNTSAMKRFFGDKAPSMGLNELEHFLDEHDYALLTKLKILAPHSFSIMEKYLGITFSPNEKIPEAVRRLPLYLYRGRLFIAVAAAIIALESAKVADKTVSEKEG